MSRQGCWLRFSLNWTRICHIWAMAVQTELSSASLTSSCRNNSSSSAESASGTGSPIGWRAADLWVYKSWGISWSRRVTRLYNVGCWLVASFGIVAIFPILFWTHVLFLGFTIVARKFGRPFFLKKNSYKYYKYYKYHTFIGKKNKDFNCSHLKSLLKWGFCFPGKKIFDFPL